MTTMHPSDTGDARKNSTELLLGAAALALAVAMVGSNRWFPAVDDECTIIDRATKPALETIRLFTHGTGEHEHPPLYDLILHGWLRITSGEMQLLRIPAILFYILAALVLAKAGERIAGKRGQVGVFCVVAVWPCGFHFGRLACWYSFSFLIVSLLTLTYLNYAEQRTAKNWLWLLACGVALIYTNYFGWAILACLALDFLYRNRASLAGALRSIAGMSVLLLLANLPILMPFLHEMHTGVRQNRSPLSVLFLGLYNVYCLFVSESVAPWFWYFGVPAGLAIAVCVLLLFLYGQVKNRFLWYFAGLFAVMTVLGIIDAKRTLLIGAWLALPLGIALGTVQPNWVRRTLFASFFFVIAIGWYGIFSRNMYAAPHWTEPWPELATQAASTVNQGGIVVANNPTFFFYLTYALTSVDAQGGGVLHGVLPVTAHHQGVYNPEQWVAAGRPERTSMVVVKGLNFPKPLTAIEEAMLWLDGRCRVDDAQRLAEDRGARWKQRYMPSIPQPEWRIEVKRYTCP